MAQYKLNRNYILHTKTGNTIAFKRNEPVFVPNHCAREVLAIGAELVDGDEVDVLEDEVEVQTMSPEERSEKLKEAFKIMTSRAERNDFTGTGMPNLWAVQKLVGFEIDSKERNAVWEEFLTEQEQAA